MNSLVMYLVTLGVIVWILVFLASAGALTLASRRVASASDLLSAGATATGISGLIILATYLSQVGQDSHPAALLFRMVGAFTMTSLAFIGLVSVGRRAIPLPGHYVFAVGLGVAGALIELGVLGSGTPSTMAWWLGRAALTVVLATTLMIMLRKPHGRGS